MLLVYLPFLGRMSVPLTGDQKFYLNVSLEMRERGQWLIPTFLGQADYTKPPFEYWATLLGWKIFGFGLAGALIPSVFAAIGTAWLIGEIADLIGERRSVSSAGLWFGAALGTATYGWVAQMEIWVCFFHAAAWWAGLHYLAEPHGKRDSRWLYAAFSLVGVSALVKSPLYSMFWVLGYVAYLLTSGEWELFRERCLYRAGALGIAFAAAWFAYVGIVDGERFWDQYVLQESFGKSGGNGGSFGSIWLALLYLCIPFTFFLPGAIRVLWKWRRTSDVVRLALCWSMPAAIFFSLHPYRVKTYLFILVPMLALLVDWGYARLGRGNWYRFAMMATAFAGVTLFGALGVVLFRAELVPLWVSAGFILTGITLFPLAVLGWFRGLALASLAGVLMFHAAAVSIGEADLVGLRAAIAERPSARLAMLDPSKNIWHETGLLSAALGQVIHRLQSLDEVVEALRAGEVVALSDEQSSRLDEIRAKLMGLGEMRGLEVRPWSRWKTVRKFPLETLIREGRGAIDFDLATKRIFLVVWL